MIITITPTQREMILHRPDDCIADALEEGYAREDVAAVHDAIIAGLNAKHLDTQAADEINPGIARSVLVEIIEGSTWIECMVGTTSEAVISRHINILSELAGDIELAYQLKAGSIDVPIY